MSRFVNSIDFALKTQIKLFFALVGGVVLCRVFWPANTFAVFSGLLLIAVLHALFAVRNTVAKVLCVAGLAVSAQYIEPLCDPTRKIELPGLGAGFSSGWVIAGGVLLVIVLVAWAAGSGSDEGEGDQESTPAPTQKQLDYAQKIAKLRGLEIPGDCLASRAKMSAFIGRNVRR